MKKKINKKGFTLIEVLVVVLIIGILAAVALPQYKKAVEKSKVSEALMNIDVIEGSMQRYVLAYGYPSKYTHGAELLDIDLSGGEWIGNAYKTDNFIYGLYCWKDGCLTGVRDSKDNYALEVYFSSSEIYYVCYTQETDIGRYICKYLKSQGWQYADETY